MSVPDSSLSSRDVHSPALASLRAVLAHAESEPEDRVAIHCGGGLRITNVTWADLRAVIDEAKAEERADLKSWLQAELRQAEEDVVMATSDSGSTLAAMKMGVYGRVVRHLDGEL